MPKVKISEYSQTASSNTDINAININEGCPPSTINNAIRELMAQIKDFQVGSEGDGLTVGGNLVVSGSTSAVTATITNVVSSNATITGGSITGITDILVADGGTGRSSLTANNVLLGNGTSPVEFVAPGTTGNILTSNGTTWASAAPAIGGQYLGTATIKAIAYNAQTIGENITISATQNGLSSGPITIDSGFTVTISSGGNWAIV